MPDQIELVYNAEFFHQLGQRVVATLADHFRQLQTNPAACRVLNWHEPKQNVAWAQQELNRPLNWPAEKQDVADRWIGLVEQALHRGQNLHHPRYLGHQVPPPIPIAALFDLVGAATNQVMAIYEMGPWSTAVERVLIERLGSLVGYPAGEFGGICTHGGSLANLTGLLAARNVALARVWQAGLSRTPSQPVLVVQSDMHYSVIRAAGILGLGTEQIRRVPLDAQRRMDLTALEQCLHSEQQKGATVVAVCAAAGATPTGAFDPIPAIAEICRRHDVWLHVDAAHGGATLFSSTYRHQAAGLELADSLVIDAHKMLFVPALCAFLFYRQRQHRFAAFEQDAPYLFDPLAPGSAEYDNGTQTLECTKRAAAFGLWGVWATFGDKLFADLVDRTFGLARRWAEMLDAAPDFELLYQPQANIVTFRYVPPAARDWPIEQLGQFQLTLRRALIESGTAYVVPVKLDGVGALRSTLMNPLTTDHDLQAVLAAIRHYGQTVLSAQSAPVSSPATHTFPLSLRGNP